MEWSRVAISLEDDTESNFKDSLASVVGLDTDAYASHHRFMNDIPHLEDVMQMHGKSMEGGILFSGESNFNSAIKSFDDAISNLGAIPMESGLEIPINSNVIEDIVLETTKIAGRQIVRLIAPERFGGILETFSLPFGSEFDGAIWNGNTLRIDYKF